ncbi:SAM-dependent methyltransferase [Luteolibacter pohnpeiensis]|uniref:SAM-dependent methyltransferase n=1 Tax=Luteolibacter pohnpeiensis TaxID=454153 RepID=A0A934S6N0_9BACT|nr:SAM-dependent methyltransferase [Luteolibacter pohnpeiensis]MBK1881776.1 SAM-dependent methyltransferase [Luteolibacter pohnpeiensis]
MASESGTLISFEQFMQDALYHPKRGYYSRHIKGIGVRGDFTTTPQWSTAPAQAIARWVANAMREFDTQHLIEIGPGSGSLAAAVRKNLPWTLRRRLKLHLVERSPSLTEMQRNLLGDHATWHLHPSTALEAAKGHAVIYSNELVDAFPVRRFTKTSEGWREIALSLRPVIQEHLLAGAPLPESSGFSENHPVGQHIEVHESYHQWLKSWLPLWKSGRILTIDYGAPAETLYHRRPGGTVRGYLLHQRLEGPAIYQNIGRQDLTADVNFTDLIHWSQPWCGDSILSSFSDFLGAIPEKDKALLDPHGAGSAFLVLDQKCR